MNTRVTKVGETVAYNGDCLNVMDALIALGVTVDSIVTDPPYHLTGGGTGTRGFMGKEWDGGDVAFNPATWRRCYDLLKPGGYLLAFSGSRTYHRMACAIEDAGFEIRDQLMWLYSTGFPKSHDVSKAIDKAAGAEREVLSERPAYGIGGNGILGGHADGATAKVTAPATDAAREWQGWGTALKPAHEPIVMARKPLIGTVAANVLAHGTGAINIDACRVAAPGVNLGRNNHARTDGTSYVVQREDRYIDNSGDKGRFPANVLHDGSDEVLEAFPDARGQIAAASTNPETRKNQNVYGEMRRGSDAGPPRNDSGTAARFFYCAKASKKDRAGSKHPTVKPPDLIEYLCKLVTRPGGTVLDPFAGSGTLGSAWPRSILIEREAEYYDDILRRLNDA